MIDKSKELSTWEFLLSRHLRSGDFDGAARMVKQIAEEEAQSKAGNVAIILFVNLGIILWILWSELK